MAGHPWLPNGPAGLVRDDFIAWNWYRFSSFALRSFGWAPFAAWSILGTPEFVFFWALGLVDRCVLVALGSFRRRSGVACCRNDFTTQWRCCVEDLVNPGVHVFVSIFSGAPKRQASNYCPQPPPPPPLHRRLVVSQERIECEFSDVSQERRAIRENPAVIPKLGAFFVHDDRGGGGGRGSGGMARAGKQQRRRDGEDGSGEEGGEEEEVGVGVGRWRADTLPSPKKKSAGVERR